MRGIAFRRGNKRSLPRRYRDEFIKIYQKYFDEGYTLKRASLLININLSEIEDETRR